MRYGELPQHLAMRKSSSGRDYGFIMVWSLLFRGPPLLPKRCCSILLVHAVLLLCIHLTDAVLLLMQSS